MIPNQWYVILDSNDLKKNKPIKVKRLGIYLALWRDSNGKACCIQDQCCHRGASLGIGEVKHDHLACPFHGFEFDSAGKVRHIPANGKQKPVPPQMQVRSYQTYESYGLIWIWWGDSSVSAAEPPFFSELADFSYSSFQDHWKVHYSRAIENQLDVVHLPFVHRTTIGRGNKTLVNGPKVILQDGLLSFYVDNVLDDGTTIPRKPDEIEQYEHLFKLQFRFPNTWQNFISDKIRAFAAFIPVDEENTIVLIRYYQRMVKIPLLREFFNYIGKVSSIIILRQDKRVVETQRPLKSTLKMGEMLIPGDRPIVDYRKYREDLIGKIE